MSSVTNKVILTALKNPKVVLFTVLAIVGLALLLTVIATGAGVANSIQQTVAVGASCMNNASNNDAINKYKDSDGYKNLSDEQKSAQDERIKTSQTTTGGTRCGGFGYTGAMYPPAFGRITDDYGVREESGRWHGGIDIQYAGTSPYADAQPPAVVATDKTGKSVTIQPCDPRGCRHALDGGVGDSTCGQPIYAMFGGEVIIGHGNDPGGEGYDSGTYSGGGGTLGMIIIKVKDDLYLRYYHTRSSSDVVIPGQLVDAGQVIGYSWSNGNTTACHVHVEVWGIDPNTGKNCPINATVPANGGHTGVCTSVTGGTYNPATILAQGGFWYGHGHIFQPDPIPEPPAPGSSDTPVVPIPDWAKFADANGWTGGFSSPY